MTLLRASVVLFAVLLGTPADLAYARPNDGRYARSSEAMKKADLAACGDILKEVKVWETKADKAAGTKAAKKYSDEADDWWDAGKAMGCSWAK